MVRQRRGDLDSDVIGFVHSTDPLVIRRGEELVEITHLHIIKKLSPRTVRNSDIRAVETATAKAFPGQEQVLIQLSLIHISEPTRPVCSSRMPSSA